MEDLRLYFATYNVGTSGPEEDLYHFLSLHKSKARHDKLADFYVLGFQEVKSQPQNMLMDTLFEDSWSSACREVLRKKGYIKVKSVRLQGLLLNVFCLKKHLINIRDIDSDYTRTGLAGMWGNKGAVSVRLSIYGCSICIVNSHLSAHDELLKDRIADYNGIVKEQTFHVPETSKIFYHDYVFWLGDLNFRLSEALDESPASIERMVHANDTQKLFVHDQLREVMRNGEAFNELQEMDPPFPPTFKFEVGTNRYNCKRRPAWCDRILYCVNSNNYENVTLQAEQLSYKSHPNYVLSDHKPVSAEFLIKMAPKSLARNSPLSVDQVFSDYGECVVEFEKVRGWEEGSVNTAFYRINKEIPATKEDWIGLFKDNFSSLDEYVTYEYVSKCTSPVLDSRSGPPQMSRPTRFQVTFAELPNRCNGSFCLIYFSQNEDKVTSVLGISDHFSIVKNDSE